TLHLSARGLHGPDIPRVANADISAFRHELRFTANPCGANVPSTGVQIRLTVNEASINVSARGERVQIASSAFHLDVTTLRLKFCARRHYSMPARTFDRIHGKAPGHNISALSHQRHCTAYIGRQNITRACVDIEPVARRDRYFEMYPELRAV